MTNTTNMIDGPTWPQPVITNGKIAGTCPHCSGNGYFTVHTGQCPKVKAIEYHANGSIKRVEFK